MRRHWPTPAINWPLFIAGPAAPTAELPGRVHGPDPQPWARLLLDVERGKIAASNATAPSCFKCFMVVSISGIHR
jgi:hypothetical protein